MTSTFPGPKATWLLLAVLLLFGAGLRRGYLRELERAPDFAAPLADAAFHDYWARGLAFGQWTPPGEEADPRIREVPFLRPPAYPYFLAAVYRLTGEGYTGPRVAQMILGLVNCVLAFLLGRALFGRGVGLVLAALCATSWTSIYFEGELEAPVLVQTGVLAVLLVLHRWSASPSARLAAAGGLLAGLLALVRANALLFLPVAAVWMLWTGRRAGARTGPSIAAFLLGAVVAVAPATVRNVMVSHELVLVSCNGPVNLYIGNNETSDGITARIPILETHTDMKGWSWFSYDRIVRQIGRHEGRDLSYSDASSYFTGLARQWIMTHPWDFARLTMKRAALFWGPAEISNTKALALEKENSRVLRHLPGFPIVLALAAAGLVALGFARRRRSGIPHGPTLALVGLLIGTWWVSFIPFLSAARFRVPLLPLLLLFGAYGIAELARSVRTARWAGAGAMAGTGVAVFLLLGTAQGKSRTDRAWWHTDRGVALLHQGRSREALEEFGAALAANPGYVDAHVAAAGALAESGRGREAIDHYREVLRYRPERWVLRMRLAALLMEQHAYGEAAGEIRQVATVKQDDPEVYFQLGRALMESGHGQEGIDAMNESLRLQPGQAPAHLNIGITLAQLGRTTEALEEIDRALALDPFAAPAHFQRGNVLTTLQKWNEAEEAFREAIRIAPKSLEAHVHLGNVYNATGRYTDAVTAYEAALAIDPTHVVARFDLSAALANLGRLDEAIADLEKALQIEPGNAAVRQRLDMMRAARR